MAKQPGEGAKSTTLPRRVERALADVFELADGVLIIAVRSGGATDPGEVVVMRHAGSTLMLEGGISGLIDHGLLRSGMTLDVTDDDDD